MVFQGLQLAIGALLEHTILDVEGLVSRMDEIDLRRQHVAIKLRPVARIGGRFHQRVFKIVFGIKHEYP